MTVAKVLRVLFGAIAVLWAWLCLLGAYVYVQTLLKPLPPGSCGQPVLSFLFVFAILWATALVLVVYDGVQLRRGKLSQPMRWLRTAPALATVLTAPVMTLFVWMARNA